MFKKFTTNIAHILLAGLIAGGMIAPLAVLADAVPQILGKSIGEWSAVWWQWAVSIPTSTNPMLDTTGADCGVSQKGPVWFLAGYLGGGSAVERDCTVPRGKYILFPIVNSIWIQTPLDDPHTETDYRRLAHEYLPAGVGGDIEATLDETPIIYNPNTPIIESQSPVFTATFPIDNIFGLDPSYLTGYPIVSDGWWVVLPPLTPDEHVLHFRAGQSQDVTYHLTVGKP